MRRAPTATVGDSCPQCSTPTVAIPASGIPWCPQCELGLDTYDAAAAPWRGTRWLSRWGYRRAFVLDGELRAQIAADPSLAAVRGRAETALVVVSALITVVSLVCFTGAVLVWSRSDWLLPITFFASVALTVLGLWTRPRFGRLPRSVARVAPEQAPALRGLVRDVASAVGAPEPDVLVLDGDDVNMAVARVGVRGSSVLVIGIPFWLLLTPAMRIAVLAHELGHLTNRDPLRATMTQPATALFESAVEWTGGHNPWGQLGERLDRDGTDTLSSVVVRLLLAGVNTVFSTMQLGIDAVVMPDHRRAEYAADLASRDAAGSVAAVAMLDRLTIIEDLANGLEHDAVTTGPTGWVALADRRQEQLRGQLPVRRQASRRTVDLWVTHPPSGSRAALIEALPLVPATVPVDAAQFERIDAELRDWYAACHREILGTRDFLG